MIRLDERFQYVEQKKKTNETVKLGLLKSSSGDSSGDYKNLSMRLELETS